MEHQNRTDHEFLKQLDPHAEATLFADNDTPNDPASDLLWAISRADEGQFFKLPLLEKLLRRPYHVATVEGPFQTQRLLKSYRDKVYRSEILHGRKAKPALKRLLLSLDNGAYAYVEESSVTLYAPSPQQAQRAAAEFRRLRKTDACSKPGFYLIGLDQGGPYTEKVPIDSSASASELTLHYGEGFDTWERAWIERMQQRSSGVSILFGPAGCGKTSYVRGLMARQLRRFVFYYLPISQFDLLTNPRFVGFWVQQARLHEGKHKIVILEDAEDLLLPRDEGSRIQVSNLLNIGDGFLGAYLKLHVIATTNVPIQQFDSALLRPGRLMGTREFRRLSRIEAIRLAQAKGLELPDQTDYSLAEIYCGSPVSVQLNCGRRLGFRASA